MESEGYNLEEKDEAASLPEVNCDYHVFCESHIDAIMSCCAAQDVPFEMKGKAKPALTRFVFLKYLPQSDHSIVRCHPATGRTHQIRVHLKALGYPIAND